jgi:molecular chaperone GrpE
MVKNYSKGSQKKIKDLEERLTMEQKKADDYLNRLKYLQADFENYRKRTEKEANELTVRGNEKIVGELLGVIDDLERAIHSGKETDDLSSLLKGVEMIHQNLACILQKEGLENIDAVGKVFDPNFHEVVVKIPRKDCEEGLVLEEVRKGFVFKGRVLRPCMVNISCLADKEKNKND